MQDLEVLWAKSSVGGGLPVIRHVADVAAVATALFELLPEQRKNRVALNLRLTRAQASAWIATIVGAHDIGKATPGFQAKWSEGKRIAEEAGFSFPVAAPDRHDASSQIILQRFLQGKGIVRADAADLSAAVAAHHGFRIDANELRRAGAFPLAEPWLKAQREILGALASLNGADGIPSLSGSEEERGAFLVWLAGLCSVSDWIGSSETYFPHDRSRVPHDVWFERSLGAARNAVAECGFSASGNGRRPVISHDTAIGLALGSGMQPRPLQKAVGTLLASGIDAPALFLVEAPMGEGKTEAALAIDAWLRANTGSRGLYLAMPTQATSNALFERVARYLARLAVEEPIELHLAHSGAKGGAASLRLREIGFGASDSTVRASDWLSGPKRTMLASNAIGTVDQALVGVLNAKHHFVRLYGLSDRLVVLDEVHAYDTYTGGLIERLVSWLKSQGCSVVIMSATLPRGRAQAILSAWGGAALPNAAYPRVVLSSGSRLEALSAPASRHWTVDIRVIGEEITEVADLAAETAGRQAAVLVVANKVDRAQRIYEAVRIKTPRAILFHARFPLEDRIAIERKVLNRFGKDGTDRRGFVVVATQVAEQSLDVDFDVLLTDLAPVDLLMQRIGRLHRHERTRPDGFGKPEVLISGLEEASALGMRLTSRVYSDLPVLRTVAWLAGRAHLAMPDDIDAAVQWVYGDSVPTGTSPAMSAALDGAAVLHARERQEQSQLALLAGLPQPSDWRTGTQAQQIPDDDACEGRLRFGTRLGEDSALAIPVFLMADGFSVLGEQTDWASAGPVPAAAARRLSARTIRVSNRRLLADLRKQAAIPGWNTAAGISHTLPLVLGADRAKRMDEMIVELDPELGLVIRSILGDARANA
jgi:CRISPR-associated endonuclease/helicase Cas3